MCSFVKKRTIGQIDLSPFSTYLCTMETLLQNLLLGTAIGDAFGAGLEFQDRRWIRKNVDFTQFIHARHTIHVPEDQIEAFIRNYKEWDYTDDTEMTIGTIKAIISNQPITEELLLQKWTEEYHQGITEKGYGRNGHGSMRWYYEGDKSIAEIHDFQRHRNNPGNAPAMRAVPFGFVASHQMNAYAEINARATHPNPAAILSSQCIASAAEWILVKNGNPQNVIQYCQTTIPLNEEYKTYLTRVAELPEYEALQESDFETLLGPQPIRAPYFLAGIYGLPSDSKFTAGAVLYILQQSDNAFDALKKSICLGGDVDSVASITTGIAAARYGITSLPLWMQENVECPAYLRSIACQWAEFLSKHTP
jgi:ADP-ribosylglycohydrolase